MKVRGHSTREMCTMLVQTTIVKNKTYDVEYNTKAVFKDRLSECVYLYSGTIKTCTTQSLERFLAGSGIY